MVGLIIVHHAEVMILSRIKTTPTEILRVLVVSATVCGGRDLDYDKERKGKYMENKDGL